MKYLFESKRQNKWDDETFFALINSEIHNNDKMLSKRKILENISKLEEITEPYILLLENISKLYFVTYDNSNSEVELAIGTGLYNSCTQSTIRFRLKDPNFVRLMFNSCQTMSEISLILVIEKDGSQHRVVAKPLNYTQIIKHDMKTVYLTYQLIDYSENEVGKVIGFVTNVELGNTNLYQLDGSYQDMTILKISY